MERRIHRQFVLSQDEVREAIYWWLKNHCDVPVPDDPVKLGLAEYGLKTEVSWTEDAAAEAA
jgi:hypothetical protein